MTRPCDLFGSFYLEPKHYLLALVKEGSGVAIQVLRNLSVDPEKIVMEIERRVEKGSPIENLPLPELTPSSLNIRMYAREEAQTLKHVHEGTEHILLALLRDDNGDRRTSFDESLQACVLGIVRTEIETIISQPNDWGRKPSLPQFPHKLAAKRFQPYCEVPKACPKCGHAPLVLVSWQGLPLSKEDLEEIDKGLTIVGSPAFDNEGPPWVCLQWRCEKSGLRFTV